MPKRQRQRVAKLFLTLAAALIAGGLALAAFYVLTPVAFDGLGLLGLLALAFPLHLGPAALGAAGLAALSFVRRAGLAAVFFSLAGVIAVFLALAPCFSFVQYAEAQGVILSFGDYWANAFHINGGEPRAELSVAYGAAPDGTPLLMDVWQAKRGEGEGLHPAIVKIHGGAWTRGARGEFEDWNAWLNDQGYDVFDLDYRLAPVANWRDEIADVKCALSFIAARANDMKLDPNRIILMGLSAGANLAMLAAYENQEPTAKACAEAATRVRAVIEFYGPVDLTLGYRDSGSLNYAQNALTRYIGGAPDEFPERYEALSPLSHISGNSPPTIGFYGENDRIVSTAQAALLDEALAKAGVKREIYVLPATDHGFDFNWGGFATQFARQKIKAFLVANG